MQSLYQARALYDYRSAHDDDLSFSAGQIIHVSGAEDDEWLIGSFHDEIGTLYSGLFPKNFVEVLKTPIREPLILPISSPHIADSETPAHTAVSGTTARETISDEGQIHKMPSASGSPETSASTTTAQRESVVRPKSSSPIEEKTLSTSKTTDLGIKGDSPETSQLSAPTQITTAAKQPIRSSAEATINPRQSPTSRSAEPRANHPVNIEKPQKINAFKDRIAAFNKQETTPIAPKPMPKPSLAKKPFMAPPPSKSAFLLQTQNLPSRKTTVSDSGAAHVEQMASMPVSSQQGPLSNLSDTNFQPRPGNLKDRIAALQEENLQLASKGDLAEDNKSRSKDLPSIQGEIPGLPGSLSGPVDLAHESDESHRGKDDPTTFQSSVPTSENPINENDQVKPIRHESEYESSLDLSSQPRKTENTPLNAAADSAVGTHASESFTSIQAGDNQQSTSELGLDEEQIRKEQLRQRMAKMSGMGMGMHMALGMTNTRQPTAKKAQVQSPHVDTNVSNPVHPEAIPSSEADTTSPQLARASAVDREISATASASEALEIDTNIAPLRSNSRHTIVTSEHQSTDFSQLASPGDQSDRSYSDTVQPSPYEVTTPSTSSENNVFPLVPSRPEARSQLIQSDADHGQKVISTRHMPPIPDSLPSPVVPSEEDEKRGSIDDQVGQTFEKDMDIPMPDNSQIQERGDITETESGRPQSITIQGASNPENPLSIGAARPPPPIPEVDLYSDRNVRITSPITRTAPPVPTASSPPQRPAAIAPNLPRGPAPAIPARTIPHVMESDELEESDAATDSTEFRSEAVEPRGPLSKSRSYVDTKPVETKLIARQDLPDVRSSIDSSRNRRRSIDSRKDVHDEYMAKDIDIDLSSHWWTRRDVAPPSLQNRQDLCYEMDETNNTRRGGRTTITKEIYILYWDYSQSIVSAQFDADNVDNISFTQEHKRPPPLPSRERLEAESARFGQSIVSLAHKRLGTTVGGAESFALIRDIFSELPEALPAAGIRGYGVPIYINIGNASVASADEIRPGDILAFRNAKLTGHKGAMKSKYSLEVGKPDHCAVVSDWDGTKRKIKCYEQGREGKKVTQVSYKLDDLKSGEARIWRVMSRDYVGWNTP